MRRRLFNALTLLSLLLFAAVCALWGRSYWVGDQLEYCRRVHSKGSDLERFYYVQSRLGGVMIGNVTDYLPDEWASQQGWGYWHPHTLAYPGPDPDAASCIGALGVYYQRGIRRTFPEQQLAYLWTSVTVPHAVPAALLTLMPAASLLRSRRARPGLCPGCGYDLRATPDRCPECGTAVVTAARAARPVGGAR